VTTSYFSLPHHDQDNQLKEDEMGGTYNTHGK